MWGVASKQQTDADRDRASGKDERSRSRRAFTDVMVSPASAAHASLEEHKRNRADEYGRDQSPEQRLVTLVELDLHGHRYE
jgi:hypothetical protein